MARTRTAPWDYREPQVTVAQLQEDGIFIKYCMILNRLERDYGIDRVANITRPWREYATAKKLELAQWLEEMLDGGDCYCSDRVACYFCKVANQQHYGDIIPIGGE